MSAYEINLFPKSFHFAMLALENQIKQWQEKLANDDGSEDELSDIGNDLPLLEIALDEMKRAYQDNEREVGHNQNAELSDHEMLRYNRQIILKNIDFDGQEKLKAARALIVGLGGLGCAASQYLASAGIGHLTLVDFDTVSLSNLQRQILHTDRNIGQGKVFSARDSLHKINPNIDINVLNIRVEQDAIWNNLIQEYDVVVDCTDNVTVRNILNTLCYQTKIPLVSGSAIRFEGQVSVFRYQENEPCYQCLSQLFGDTTLSCVEAGVIAPIVGVVGSIQALETIKVLLNIGKTLSGKLLMIDGLHFSVREMALPKQPNCPVCAGFK